MEHIPHVVQRWCAPNDTNGNPRRCWVIWDDQGILLDAIDEGYASRPGWIRLVPINLGDVTVPTADYRRILKAAKHS